MLWHILTIGDIAALCGNVFSSTLAVGEPIAIIGVDLNCGYF